MLSHEKAYIVAVVAVAINLTNAINMTLHQFDHIKRFYVIAIYRVRVQ
jgi:hypothetical protein